MRKALVAMLLAMASPVMAFPEAASRATQSWGKVEFIMFQTEGFQNGYFYDFRTGNHFTFMSKQALLFLRGIVAIEGGGIGNLKHQGVAIAPSLNAAGLFEAIPLIGKAFEKAPIINRLSAGYTLGWVPNGIVYEKGTAYFAHGFRIGPVYKW